ncbi:MAG: glycosyltransferase family 2 protein [Candidatus Woesearchaeota archaeon]
MTINENTWVIIPAHNEENRISSVIDRVRKHVGNIVVVDDGSTDNTGKVVNKVKALVLVHILNLGKGAAVKTGCDFALKKGAEKIILIDADGQHDPDEIPRFLKALEKVDIVFGYRKFTKTMPVIFRFGNKFIDSITRFLYGIKLRDTQCGYRAFTSRAYRKIRWKSSDYAMESEMIANVGKYRLSYAQLKIDTLYPERYKGTTILDGIKIVISMIWWRLKK